jgi:osmotically-inducible protein OsmY
MLRLVLSAAAGAACMYFLDPKQGRRRRHLARDRAAATVRRTSRRLARAGQTTGAHAYGLAKKATHRTPEVPVPPNDVTLTRKVETAVFRDPAIPKGRININAEGGVIVLRGELDGPEQIKSVEAAAARVPGVQEVENLLHLPGTPARMH